MQNKRVKYIISGLLALLVGYILYDSLSQPGINDLKGNFREVGLYRNPNNTGPIIRIYTVAVTGTPWDEMQQYGEMMPYNKYGTTTVYFFPNGKPTPDKLSPGKPNFGSEFNVHCLGKYQKDANGQVSFEKFPFKL